MSTNLEQEVYCNVSARISNSIAAYLKICIAVIMQFYINTKVTKCWHRGETIHSTRLRTFWVNIYSDLRFEKIKKEEEEEEQYTYAVYLWCSV